MPLIPGEPCGPHITTNIPGEKATQGLAQLHQVFDTQNATLMLNYDRSIGNYACDPDGNLLLDVSAQIASIPVGYNNAHLQQVARSEQMISATINRPAMGVYPQHDWLDILQSGILKVAPPGLNQVSTAMAGSDANETAYKAAFMWKRSKDRGGHHVGFTDHEMSSSLENRAPGAPSLSIMSFQKGFHGRLFGSLSTTRSKAIHKLDIPAFDWPVCPFPSIRYPLDKFESENALEESRCLEEAERIITTYHNPVAAVIVEPIQSEGGDNHASSHFFRKLREMTRRLDVLLIVDEVQTGVGATGKFWAHEHWNLTDPPDMVTFSKKAQAAGYYYADPSLRPNKPFRQFNTWMGDPSKAILFRGIVEQIEELDLLNNVTRVGDFLYNGLERLSEEFPTEFSNLRGKDCGTFIAFDVKNRDDFVKRARTLGVNMGASGPTSVRLRPMLVFQEQHATILLNTVRRLVVEA
jgi:4-aminobutyrate aminotransferase/(S)-3-amino-2-methylpropionate transaminase